MIVDIRAKLDFFDLDDFLPLARFRRLFLGLEFIFAEVHNLADGNFTVHRNLYKIQPRFLGLRERIALINIAVIFSSLINKLNIACNYGIVNARTLFSGCTSNRTAYVTSPLVKVSGELLCTNSTRLSWNLG